ncbi:MAG: diacylglycerol kinase family protein [Bacilli bacterium]|nr:diacylglycerol kinase family protein [Bacilli bacterium]
MKKSKYQNKNILVSFKYAFEGLLTALKTERNLRVDALAMILVIIFGFIFKISKLEWVICIVLSALVISAEVVNTVLETIVDMITEEINPKAKFAKDLAAAHVLIIALSSFVVGLFIFIPKIIDLFK